MKKSLNVWISLGTEYNWSAAFSLSNVWNFAVWITAQHPFNAEMIGVEIQLKGATFWIWFYDVEEDICPYCIENCIPYDMTISQKLSDDKVFPRNLPSHSILLFTWDEPLQYHCIIVAVANTKTKREFGLDKIKGEKEWVLDTDQIKIENTGLC